MNAWNGKKQAARRLPGGDYRHGEQGGPILAGLCAERALYQCRDVTVGLQARNGVGRYLQREGQRTGALPECREERVHRVAAGGRLADGPHHIVEQSRRPGRRSGADS